MTEENINNKLENVNNKLENINNKLENVKNNLEKSFTDKKSFIQNIKDFFKTDFYFFIKNYLFFMVLFSICFYILLYVNNLSNDNTELIVTKIFFYLIIVFLFIFISDMLQTPLESQKKFILTILLSLTAVHIISHLIEYFYPNSTFNSKLLKVFLASLLIFAANVIIIFFTFQKDKNIAISLYNSFNYAMNNNLFFLIFIVIYLFIYKNIFTFLNNWNSSLSNILCPALLGLFLMFFIFTLIIYISYKMKIINKMQFLNTYIALFSIAVFLGFNYCNIFMSSLSTICKTKDDAAAIHTEEKVILLLLISIFIILWYDDVRNWHTRGSILFVLASLFGLYCVFYYSKTHPSIGTISFWFFVEWLIIIFYRKQNSRNSLHYSFMNL